MSEVYRSKNLSHHTQRKGVFNDTSIQCLAVPSETILNRRKKFHVAFGTADERSEAKKTINRSEEMMHFSALKKPQHTNRTELFKEPIYIAGKQLKKLETTASTTLTTTTTSSSSATNTIQTNTNIDYVGSNKKDIKKEIAYYHTCEETSSVRFT